MEGLKGSEHAKKRLHEVLRTISGECTIEEACRELGIGRTRFFDLRQSLLEEMVERLEPRPRGRPSERDEKSERVEALERRIGQLEVELEASQIRADLNAFLPLFGRKKNDR